MKTICKHNRPSDICGIGNPIHEEKQDGKIAELVAKWRDMSAEEMRLRAGDMTVQEIRSIKAVLNAILPNEQ